MTKSKKYRGIIITVLVIALIFVAYYVFANLNRGEKITYSEFQQKVYNQEVTDVYGTGATFRIRVKDSKIPQEKFASVSSADYVLTVSTGDMIGKMMDLIDKYNNGELIKDSAGNFITPEVKITFNSEPEPENWLSVILPYLSIAFVAILAFMIIKSISAQNNKNMSFGKTRARNTQISKVKFSDVAGAKEEKQELIEVVDFLKNPRKYTDLGARIPKGILLVGPPGTGKTMLAKAVAGESNVPFFKISGSDFVEMFVGVGASRVRDLFDQAKQNAPCIIFIDEIDAVGRQRGAGLGGGNDEREQTLNQLLVEMDGFESNEGIIVMAATNRPDVLDPALLRPGRFDRQIVVNMPDIKEREAILKVHARNKKFSEDVTFKNLARITSGFSGADLENLLNEAAILAGRDNRPRITMSDINEAANKVMMGPQKKSHIVTERDKKITAYHESGHAILHKLLPYTDDVQEVSIIPRGMAGGYTMSRPDSDNNYVTINQLNSMICTFMGGRVAEEIIFKDYSTGASNDIEQATKLARKMVTQFGMSEKLGFINLGSTSEVFIGRDYQTQVQYSDKTAGLIDEEMEKILKSNYEKAKKLLTENIDKLHAMAKLLLERETIYSEEVDKIMSGVPNEEIVKDLTAKENAEKEKLDEEKRLQQQDEKKRIEDIKNRAFEAMRKHGMIDEESSISKPLPKQEEKQSEMKEEKTAKENAGKKTEQNQGASKKDATDKKTDDSADNK